VKKIPKICIYSYLLASTIIGCNSVFADKIKQIEIEGNNRIEKETIQNYLKLNVGDEIDSINQDLAIKNLYSTYLFEDLKINFQDGILQVVVKEFPLIVKVEFKGNSKISSATLKKETLTRLGTSVSRSAMNADIVKIKELYKRQGKFLVNIEAKVEKLKNNRAKVIFEIGEGPKTEVKNIYFIGNRKYKDGELKSLIATKEKIWFKFWANNAYDPDKIEQDKYMLKHFYNSLGYADFQVVSVNPQISKNKDYFNITYVIEEGEKYTLGKVDVQNNIEGINVDDLQKLIKIKIGDKYNSTTLENTAENIADYLENKGYPEISVSAETINKDFQNKTIDISFVIEKAAKVYIGQINIAGNVKTQDKVIRREFKLSEGDLFNRDAIDRGDRNLRNLDYFEKLAIQPVATDKPDKYDLNIDVQEKATANIGFEAGYSSAEGPFARIAYHERNFLGTGKYLDSSITKGKKSITYSLGVTEPHFLDRNLTLGSSGFISKSGKQKGNFGVEDQPYDLTSYGGRLTLGYDVTNDVYHNIYYSYRHDHLTSNVQSSSQYIAEQQGKFNTSAVGHSLTYDQTDNRSFPKNGYILSGTQEYAGVGGDNRYLKHELDASSYVSFYENDYTLRVSTSAGEIRGIQGKKVRIRDRFNLGDPIFRGFAPGGMGPRVKNSDEGLGGQKFYKVTTELSFPLGLPKELNLTGNLFADYGALWDFDLQKNSQFSKQDVYNSTKPNLSVGAGILWLTRVAPIRIDWAIPLRKKQYDETQRWHVRFTTSF
jgi:outer membrane protein insertion porin family